MYICLHTYRCSIFGCNCKRTLDNSHGRPFVSSIRPKFSPIFIGFIVWLQHFDNRFKKPLVIFLVTNFIIVSSINIYKVKLHIKAGEIYLEHTERVRARYADLPDDAIAVFG